MQKKCSACKEIKPLSSFSIRKGLPMDRANNCRECIRECKLVNGKHREKVARRVKEWMKICSKCLEEKPFSDFGKKKRNPDGHRYWCRECRKAYRNKSGGPYKKVRVASHNKKKIVGVVNRSEKRILPCETIEEKKKRLETIKHGKFLAKRYKLIKKIAKKYMPKKKKKKNKPLLCDSYTLEMDRADIDPEFFES